MNITDIITGIETGIEIIQKVINFDVLWDYIVKAVDAIIALF